MENDQKTIFIVSLVAVVAIVAMVMIISTGANRNSRNLSGLAGGTGETRVDVANGYCILFFDGSGLYQSECKNTQTGDRSLCYITEGTTWECAQFGGRAE